MQSYMCWAAGIMKEQNGKLRLIALQRNAAGGWVKVVAIIDIADVPNPYVHSAPKHLRHAHILSVFGDHF